MYKNKILIIFLIFNLIFFEGCFKISSDEEKIKNEIKIVEEKINDLNVIVDPRIELLSIIMYLSPTYNNEVKSIIESDTSYKNDVENYFGSFRNHKAVRLFTKMSKKGFAYNAPIGTILSLNNQSNLSIKDDIDKTDTTYLENIERMGGEKFLYKFIEYLNEFCEDTDFYEFYESHKSYYKEIINRNIEYIKNTDYIFELENYYKVKQNNYNVVLSGLLTWGNYGIRIKSANNDEYDVYAVLGSHGTKDDYPYFSNKEDMEFLIRHEFSHSFINNITRKNIDLVNKYAYLLEPINNIMSNQAYGVWEVSLNEHLVRAVVIRLTQLNNPKNDITNIIFNDENNGFIYIREFLNILENDYEVNDYENFEAFYPKILELLGEL